MELNRTIFSIKGNTQSGKTRLVMFQFLKKVLFCTFFYASFLTSTFAEALLSDEQTSCVPSTTAIQETVSEVLSGDTFRLNDGRIVKLAGIESPKYNVREPSYSENGALQAFQYLTQLLPIKTPIHIYLDEKKQDRYGHILAFVKRSNDDLDVVGTMLRQGWARQITHPPNEKKWLCLQVLERAAQNEYIGLWHYLRYWPRITHFIAKSDAGYIRLQGEITSMERSRRYLTLVLDKKIWLGIKLDDLHYFSKNFELDLLHKKVDVRGWLYFSHDKLRMRVRHPQQINLL